MKRIKTPIGVMILYDTHGSGSPLILVHESFSDHHTNWQEVKLLLKDRFSVYAVAWCGRGDSSATHGRSVENEANGDNNSRYEEGVRAIFSGGQALYKGSSPLI